RVSSAGWMAGQGPATRLGARAAGHLDDQPGSGGRGVGRGVPCLATVRLAGSAYAPTCPGRRPTQQRDQHVPRTGPRGETTRPHAGWTHPASVRFQLPDPRQLRGSGPGPWGRPTIRRCAPKEPVLSRFDVGEDVRLADAGAGYRVVPPVRPHRIDVRAAHRDAVVVPDERPAAEEPLVGIPGAGADPAAGPGDAAIGRPRLPGVDADVPGVEPAVEPDRVQAPVAGRRDPREELVVAGGVA